MKKVLLLTAVCFVALAVTGQDPDLVIPKFDAPPTIDGVVDEVWNLIPEVYVEVQSADNTVGDATLNDAWFKMGWNDSSLFMLVRRDDDDFADQWETGLADWQSDRDEIFLDVHVDTLADGRGASDSQQGASYGHYQFTSIWVQDTEDWVGNPSQWYHNAPFTFGYVRDGDAYYSEYAFPFSSLTIDTELLPHADATFQGEAGVVFGMQVSMGDVDMYDDPTDETFRKFVGWIEEGGGWTEMDNAGRVELGAEVISSIEDQYAELGIAVYPNPARSHIQLSNLPAVSSIEVFDILGHSVLSQSNVMANSLINVSSLKSGVYIVKVDNVFATKFMVE